MRDLFTTIADLQAAGVRLTPQRRAILAYLASTGEHPSARQVYVEVKKGHPDLSLATVYNTLGLLVRLGHLKVLDFEPDNRYETNTAPHINLICTVCGKIQDFAGRATVTAEEVLAKAGFQVLDNRLDFLGLCAECRAASAKGQG